MFEHNHKKRKRRKKSIRLLLQVFGKGTGAGPNDLQEHMAARCYVFGAEL